MFYCVYRNLSVDENYKMLMVISNIVIYEIDVFCWLLVEDYVLV